MVMDAFEPIRLTQEATAAGGFCVPVEYVIAIVSPLGGAVVYLVRRMDVLTRMLDQARRDHIDSYGDRDAG
jgi:hypothetical protein